MFPVGITTGYGLPLNKQPLADMKKNGIDYIELSLVREYDVSFQQIGQMTLEADIGIWSAHLPVRPKDQLDISLESPELRRHTVAHFSELISQVSDLGVDKFVLHPSTLLPDGCNREERKKCAMDTMVKLAEVAHSCGAVIAMEDMTLPCLGNSAEELLEMISVDDKLRICFDTNHLFNNTHEEFVRLLGDKIVTVHLSDYTETGEKHWFPREGIVDWPEIPKLLKSVGYNGVWLYELSLNGAKSADRGRPLTFRDFRRNADEIFAGKKPTVIAAHHRAAFPLWQVFDLREARDFLSKREYALYRQMVDAILDHSGTVENLESEEEFHKIWSLLLAEFVPSRAMGGLQNTPQKGKSVNSERSWPICLFAVNLN